MRFLLFSLVLFILLLTFQTVIMDLEEFLPTLEAIKLVCFETIEIPLLSSVKRLNIILQIAMRWLE